ncbi:MAG: adenylate/guanylate cyclase domain-containing protein [Gordonia sp. (in: high G+C Gram-positive bacteria)]|uniref:adenylate/guanylate cyclase domain-containing protein n=1 Tax=Gordonia sp. (in: high G+C Gram-positive bacteria) TaxID=84139 RepID=UPI0039E717E9
MADRPGDLGLNEQEAEELAARVWNALGFVQAPDEFSDEGVTLIKGMLGPGSTVDPAALIAASRAIGQPLARLAEWEAEQIQLLARDPAVGLSQEELIETVARVHDEVWRLHLANRLARVDTDAATDVIIGFADIVGYTAMSRRLQMVELERLLESFESQAHQIVTDHGGAVVKSLGDAVMFTAPTPAQAASIALALQDLTSDGVLPTLRIGLAEGPVLMRMGDVFGEPVNIAARLASSAREGTTLVDQNLADALSGDDEVRVKHIPTLSVRGYRRLKASALSRAPHPDAPPEPKVRESRRRAKDRKASQDDDVAED